MLEMMRRHSRSYLIYLFFGIIIVVFVFFFGPQSDFCQPSRVRDVAHVGGIPISSTQMDQLYLRSSQAESRIPAEQRLDPGARRRFLVEDVILIHLLAREARRVGMAVSDEQLSAYVRDRNRNFELREYIDREGNFSQEVYELRVPGAFGMSLIDYESWKESELLATEYLSLLMNAVPVAPAEVESRYRLRNTRYQLEYIRLDPNQLASLFEVDDEGIQAVLETDLDGVFQYWEANSADFERERQLRFSRILIQLPQDEAEQEAARALFQDAIERIEADPDEFPGIALEISSAIESDSGGDMGFKPENAWRDYQFLEGGLDDLELGVVRFHETEQQITIFRLEDEIPSLPPFEEISSEVARAMLEAEHGEDPVATLAAELLAQARSGLSLQEVLESHPLLGESVVGVSTLEEAPTTHFSVQQTQLFALDEPGINFQFLGGQFDSMPRSFGDPERIPGIGQVPQLARQLTRLSEEEPLADEVFSDGQNSYVVRLLQREDPPDSPESEALEEIRDEIWSEKVDALFGNWRERLIFHQPTPLSPVLNDLLDAALLREEVRLDTTYFQFMGEE